MRVIVAVLAPVAREISVYGRPASSSRTTCQRCARSCSSRKRAEVAEEALGGLAVGQRQDRVEEVVGGVRAPLVGSCS